jgi:hypothetical protein
MKKLLTVVILLAGVGTAVAAGLAQLFDGLKKPAPQQPVPQAPQTPKPPVKK